MTRATLIHAREGDARAMNQVLKEFDPFIYYIATQRVTSGYFDDYMQVGRIGLIEAIEKISINTKYQFSTFAGRYIRNEMALLSCQIRGQKIHEYRVIQRFFRKKREMEQRLMMVVDMIDVLEEMNLFPFQVEIINAHVQKEFVSTDVDDLVTRKIEKEIDEKDLDVLQDGREKMLKDMIDNLTDRQADIVKKHFFQEMTSAQIAESLNVSQGYILKELHKIRKKLLADWPNQLFTIALSHKGFYDPDFQFHQEKWKPVGEKYFISNYGRLQTFHKAYKKFIIRKPTFESRKYRYQLVLGNAIMKASPNKLIANHFEIHELPTFYER